MTAMEEYFPFVSKAFTVMQYTAWALLFLITVWQLFRVFGGPVTEAENPWVLLGRSALFAFLIGYAKPIFLLTLKIATAPYTALMDIQMTAEDFTFAGIRAGPSKRADQSYRHHLDGRIAAAHHTGNCAGLELFQAAA